MKLFRHSLVALTLATLLGASTAFACPMCKDTLPESSKNKSTMPGDSQGDLAAGFYYSILFMLAVPFSLAGGFGSFLYLQSRKVQANPPADQG